MLSAIVIASVMQSKWTPAVVLNILENKCPYYRNFVLLNDKIYSNRNTEMPGIAIEMQSMLKDIYICMRELSACPTQVLRDTMKRLQAENTPDSPEQIARLSYIRKLNPKNKRESKDEYEYRIYKASETTERSKWGIFITKLLFDCSQTYFPTDKDDKNNKHFLLFGGKSDEATIYELPFNIRDGKLILVNRIMRDFSGMRMIYRPLDEFDWYHKRFEMRVFK